MNAFGGVFNGVVENVDDRGAEVFGDAEGVEANSPRDRVEDDAFRGKMLALERDGDAVFDKRPEVDECAVLQTVALAELSGLEDLLDGGEETVRVGEHDLVELLALGLVDGAPLEGLEVKADAGDGGL
jgi:hypothetical protein